VATPAPEVAQGVDHGAEERAVDGAEVATGAAARQGSRPRLTTARVGSDREAEDVALLFRLIGHRDPRRTQASACRPTLLAVGNFGAAEASGGPERDRPARETAPSAPHAPRGVKPTASRRSELQAARVHSSPVKGQVPSDAPMFVKGFLGSVAQTAGRPIRSHSESRASSYQAVRRCSRAMGPSGGPADRTNASPPMRPPSRVPLQPWSCSRGTRPSDPR